MQTFMPVPDLVKSVQILDNKRLGKQRVEAMTILNTLEGRSSGWSNHPAVKMWKGYEDVLALYMNLCIIEWRRRGFRNNMKLCNRKLDLRYPKWFGNEEFHRRHRSNLLRKAPEFYKKYHWTEKPTLNYLWPAK